MSSPSDQSVYYIPANAWYPVTLALGIFFIMAGLGVWLNAIKAGEDPSHLRV